MTQVKINVTNILNSIPKIDGLSGVVKDGPLIGETLSMYWEGCRWEGSIQGNQKLRKPLPDFTISTNSGDFKIIKGFWTYYGGMGEVQGVCSKITLENSTPDSKKVKYRSVVQLPPGSDFLFPGEFIDERGAHAYHYFPLHGRNHSIDCFYLKNNNLFIFESSSINDFELFKKVANRTRLLFSYIFGVSFERESCDIIVSSDDKITHLAEFTSGRSFPIDSQYKPIPSSWGEWCAARDQLPQLKAEKFLDENKITAVWENFIQWDDLMVTIEYLQFFVPAPVEMRGAILSVALESLTDSIKKHVKLKSEKPLSKGLWNKAKISLLEILDALFKESFAAKAIRFIDKNSSDWEKAARDIIKFRLDDMNRPTNQAKLTAPFKHYGINLTTEDIEAIDKRNTFLHSGKLLKADEREVKDSWKDIYFTEMRIYTLVNRLLFSALGYKGPMTDWGKTKLGKNQREFFYN